MGVVEMFAENIKEYIDFGSVETIWDVGAGDCTESLVLADIFKNAHVYAFEANPACIHDCAKKIVNSKRVTLLPICINSHTGITVFHPINQEKTVTTWSDGNPKASSLYLSNGTYKQETYVQDDISIPCMTLFAAKEVFKLPLPDIIWMDLQGAELLALNSLYPDTKKVKIIHTEIWGKETYTGQGLFPEMEIFMAGLGYVCRHEPLPENWVWADAEFIREDLLVKGK